MNSFFYQLGAVKLTVSRDRPLRRSRLPAQGSRPGRSQSLCILTLVATLAACSQPLPVHVERAPGTDMRYYRTYSWQAPGEAVRADPRVNSDDLAWRLRNAVEEQLALRGLHPADGAQPDLWVRYDLKMREKSTDSFQDYYHYVAGGGSKGPQDAYVMGYEELGLVIDLIDARDSRRIWRGSAGIIADKQEAQHLREAVRLMFDKPL